MSSTKLSICPFVLSSSLVYSNNGLQILPKRLLSYLFSWWNFCRRAGFWEVFSFIWRMLFLSFPSFLLTWWCPLQVFLSTCNHPSLQAFLCFPDLTATFLPLFLNFHFLLYIKHGVFLDIIQFLYPDCKLLLFVSGSPVNFHFSKYRYIIYVQKVIDVFLWFCKFVSPALCIS